MKEFNLGKIPDGLEYYYGNDISSLGGYELEELSARGVEAVFYWYCTGCYEGSGQMIALRDGKWDVHNMGHCSCYGPIENFNYNFSYNSLDELLSSGSEEWKKGVYPLYRLAKENGF